MKKNILMLQVVFPNLEKEHNLYSDLAEEFAKKGHNVHVVTIHDQLDKIDNVQKYSLQVQRGVNILRVKTPTKYFNTNFVEKGITVELMPHYFNMAIKKYWDNVDFDLVVSVSMVTGFYKIIQKLKKKNSKIRTYLLLRDLFPQMANDMGVLPKPLYYHFKNQQIKLYNSADIIGCMSQGNIDYLDQNLQEITTKKEILPNWRTIRERVNIDFDFKKQYGLNDKIVAVFGGVIGIQQGLDFLLDLAANVQIDHPEFHFVIIGNGTEKERLKQRIIDEKIENVTIFDRIPSVQYEAALQQCDIGLINLHGDLGVPHVPSKTLSYYEASIPILAATDSVTDYNQIIENNECGYGVIYGDLKGYTEKLVLLKDKELRSELGRNGRQRLEEHLQSEQIAKKILYK